jgi:hypothetical protein
MKNIKRRTTNSFIFKTNRYMFRPTGVIIKTAVQKGLIEYSLVTEIISGMSVVIEWIDCLIAVEIPGWCNGGYGVH